MLANLKRKIKDDLLIGGILLACLLAVALILGSIAFEILKAFAVMKYLFS